MSWFQKASILCRCGVGGILGCAFRGELSLDLEGLCGGVVDCCGGLFDGDFSRGGELVLD